MPSLKDIREQAKRAFKSRYWYSVGLLGLIALILNLWEITPFPYTGIAYIAILLIGLIVILGSCNIGLSLAKGKILNLNTAFSPFENYGHNLGGSLWIVLFVFLWALISLVPYLIAAFAALANYALSVYFRPAYFYDTENVVSEVLNVMAVPIIIFAAALAVIVIFKSLQYFCARYILIDSPKVSATRTLNLSKIIMKGEKFKLFVLILSVMWPYLIVLCLGVGFTSASAFMEISGGDYFLTENLRTAGIIINIAAIIISVFYYLPYSQTACAIFYLKAKENAILTGRLAYADFEELPPLQAPADSDFIELS